QLAASTAHCAEAMSSATVTSRPIPAASARSAIARTSSAVRAPHASMWVCASTAEAVSASGTGGNSFFLSPLPIRSHHGAAARPGRPPPAGTAGRTAHCSRVLDRRPLRAGLGQLGVDLGEQRLGLVQRSPHLDLDRFPLGLLGLV